MAKRPSTPVDQQPAPSTRTRELPLVALRETVIFPEMIVPLQVGRDKSVSALNAAVADGGPIALVTQRHAEQEDIDDPSELYAIGTLAKIAQVVQLQDGTVRAIVQGQQRIKLLGFVNSAPGFTEQHVVMDGASNLLLSLFGERGRHARSSVGMAELPMNIAVEVEMIVQAS